MSEYDPTVPPEWRARTERRPPDAPPRYVDAGELMPVDLVARAVKRDTVLPPARLRGRRVVPGSAQGTAPDDRSAP